MYTLNIKRKSIYSVLRTLNCVLNKAAKQRQLTKCLVVVDDLALRLLAKLIP